MQTDDTEFLHDITKQVKDFYETPVVFVTMKDYTEVIFSSLCALREAFQSVDKNRISEIILDFHLQWLQTVTEIEEFKLTLEMDFPRDDMQRFLNFTIETFNSRFKIYKKYMEHNQHHINSAEQSNLQSDLEIVEEMHIEVTSALCQKIKDINEYQTELEYKVKVNAAAEGLLQWIDKMNDGLAIKITKYINVNVPHLALDLTRALQQIVEELRTTDTEEAKQMLKEIKRKGEELGSMVRITTGHNLEINKVVDKILALDDRIKRLEAIDEDKPSAALLAVKHKKEYLERRLTSLENLKTTIRSLHKGADLAIEDVEEEEICVCEDFFQLRIFNHSLSTETRERLVTDLCTLWDVAIFGENQKSMVSILSAADVKEEFTDDLGTFYVDEHSRRIYKIEGDDALYQPNEHNELVRVCDDADHVYFYDNCGRYFVDAQRQRIYKAHATASEYIMDSSGVLLKVKEVRDGVTFYYDNFGRYYINNEGKHIYREPDTTSEYENDGLGNLVRIRSHLDLFEPCPGDANVTEDFRYLKQAVGKALRRCIGQVLLHQPSDPIKYLSTSLLKFRENIEFKDKHDLEIEELNAERDVIAAEERAAAERAAITAALLLEGGSEASYDSNLAKYNAINPDDSLSYGPSSK